ncbi:hypothetical protein [Curtobacterium sp. MCPF17_031]|uniref:DUF7507 domain-containing protein n=1 Tax=Curtobacterium sp. MCPF17_031 TaxID=2175653 RepID=UPI000DA6F9D2|nr:hypothetical protein [Curtobacterium sp. MCPF17_031]PZE37588.1 hypothetical protein DEJ31_05405 [Curtobacterium sp. MCPF17_031]
MTTRHPPSRPASLLATIVVLATTTVLVSAGPSEALVPSTPRGAAAETGGGRAAPRVLLVEDFEHVVGTGPTRLDQYVGADGERYTADPGWINVAQCNGIVAAATTPGLPCPQLAPLYHALGQVNGSDPRTNHGVGAWTLDRPVPADGVQIRTLTPLPLPVKDRFVTFGVDAVATSCSQAAHPRLRFGLLDGGVEHRVTSTAIDPCTSPGSRTINALGVTVRGGRFVSDAAVLFTGDTLGWVMRNAEARDVGNDGAIDGVTVYDATPVLEHAFDGSSPYVGETARLTYTVQNTGEGGAKAGWSFRETLPDGLTLAADPHAGTTCADSRVDADPTGTAVAVTGGLRSGQGSCTVAVDVTSETATTFALTAGTVAERIGLDPPGETKITFRAEDAALSVTDLPVLDDGDGDGRADLDEGLRFAQTVENTGGRPLRDLVVTGTNGPVTCAVTELAPGASTDCASASRPVRQEDVDRGSVQDAVTATAASPRGVEVSADAAAEQPADRRSAVATTLDARLPSDGPAVPGQLVELTATVTNTGTTTLTGVIVTLPSHPDSSVSCPGAPLAPGDTVRCTVTGHALTQVDVDAGRVAFTSSATGTGPAGDTVSAQAEDEVEPAQVAELGTDLSAHLAVTDHSVPYAGDGVEIALTVTNTGNVSLRDPSVTIDERTDLPVRCPAGVLAPGQSVPCTVPATALTQDDVERGTVPFAETAVAIGPDGAPVSATDGVVVGLGAASALYLESDWTPSARTLHAGDAIASRYRVTNTSNLIASTIGVSSAAAGTITCDTDALEPGATTECAADRDRRLTPADAARGHVDFVAVAAGSVGRADAPSTTPSEPEGAVPVRSTEMTASFPVVSAVPPVHRPAPAAALAFTGSGILWAGLPAVGLLALGVGALLVARSARLRRDGHPGEVGA